LKTDAIDFGEEFYWLDDYPFQAELNVLKKYNMEDLCIIVDLNRKGELKQLIHKLFPCVQKLRTKFCCLKYS
jgi:hypothetical protein